MQTTKYIINMQLSINPTKNHVLTYALQKFPILVKLDMQSAV